MLYDTHCHPYLAQKKSQNDILENFFSWGWEYLNSISVDLDTSRSNIELSRQDKRILSVIGIHPTHILEYKDCIDDVMKELERLYRENPKSVVGIWETGLDYYWLEKLSMQSWISQSNIREIQKEFFKAHIQLAQKLWLPIVIHNRDSSEDVFTILKEENCTHFVFHCFSEDIHYAKKLLEFAPNCMLWFWGVLTFKNAETTRTVASEIPLTNIMIETDSPYLTPMPFRWKEENEPLFTRYVLDHISDIRSEDFGTIENQIFENSLKFFGIKKEV